MLPKAFVPCESNEKALLNSILKPNYWGDNYIIEFFDEKKELLTEILNIKNVSEKIYDYIRKTQRIKMDFSKIYERIGNIIFQFPITICKTGIYSEKNSNDIRLKLEYHPRQKAGKNIHIIITASFDDTITAADYYDSCDLKIDHIFHLGDDYNLTTTILDKDNNLFLHKSTVNFIKKNKYFVIFGNNLFRTETFKNRNGAQRNRSSPSYIFWNKHSNKGLYRLY